MAGFDYGRLRGILAQTKLQSDNNSLFQLLNQLIDGAENVQQQVLDNLGDDDLAELIEQLRALRNINILEIHTAGGPSSFALTDIVAGLTEVKDIDGMASSNPITLTGTVEGTTDPVINTDWGTYRVYFGGDGALHTW